MKTDQSFAATMRRVINQYTPRSRARPGNRLAHSPSFASMKDAQHDDPLAVVAILEHVRAAEHVHHNLPVLLTTRERPTQFRMSRQELRPGDDLSSDDRRKFWRLTLKKSCETIKVR